MEPKRSEDGRASLVFSVRGPIPIQMGNIFGLNSPKSCSSKLMIVLQMKECQEEDMELLF